MVVVDAQYVEPFTVDLAVQRKSVANSNGNFTVVDVNGNVLFNIKDTLFSFHDRHILYDANDKPVLTFKKKVSFLILLLNSTCCVNCDECCWTYVV